MKEVILTSQMRNGLNVTVCRGEQWTDTTLGETLELKEEKGSESFHSAEAIGKLTMVFDLIPEELFAYEHNESCRTKEGMISALKSDDPDFNVGEIVTLLFFVLEVEAGEEAPILEV